VTDGLVLAGARDIGIHRSQRECHADRFVGDPGTSHVAFLASTAT
jgi:hypothetical protein